LIKELIPSNLNPKMNKLILYFTLIFFSSCYSATNTDQNKVASEEDYNYTVYQMPKELKEISGITFINDSIVAAIEDETGTLYLYNINQKEVVRNLTFASNGDYEDITSIDNILYIVKSNGNIYEVSDYNSDQLTVNEFKTKLKGKNNIEGICYDKNLNALLLSVKEKNLGKAGDDKKVKNIYQFQLKNKEIDTNPVYQVKLGTVEDYFKGDKITEVSKKFLKAIGNKNLNDVFKTSSIAYHPITKELYVLSSINKIVLVMDKNSNIKKIIPLNGAFFTQPEGMAFNSKGTLYISNEGKKNPGNIIKIENK
jgi:uncharacterized protein YjiK